MCIQSNKGFIDNVCDVCMGSVLGHVAVMGRRQDEMEEDLIVLDHQIRELKTQLRRQDDMAAQIAALERRIREQGDMAEHIRILENQMCELKSQ